MKNPMFTGLALMLSAMSASANGVTQGDKLAQEILEAMGSHSVVCKSATDQVTLERGKGGDLRMIAKYAGGISGRLDTDNEGFGEECGGLAIQFNSQYSDFLLDDTYNDCERGDWGYRLMIPSTALKEMGSSNKFEVTAYATDQDSKDGDTRTLECSTL